MLGTQAKSRRLLALLAVGGPCLLAAACSGQTAVPDGPAARAAPIETSGTSGTASEPGGTSPTGSTGRTSAPGRSRHTSKQSSPLALRLIKQAARAAVVTSYHGEEVTTGWDAGGAALVISDIWHTSGGPTVIHTPASSTGVQAQPLTDQDREFPEGVLGMTTTLVNLLAQHYVITYAGRSSADNRDAQVVEAWRQDDSLAARFWLDSATRLPLEREVFDPAGAHLISTGMFVNVQLGHAKAPMSPELARAAPAWTAQLAPAQLLRLARAGWLVPPGLPAGLSLFVGSQAATSAGPVLDLTYSDGLYVVSVFEQHGRLASRLPGWQQTKVSGTVVYADLPFQRELTWSGKGIVYTVIADAPAQVAAGTVAVLPHDRPPGFWKRVTRGLARLADLVNPF